MATQAVEQHTPVEIEWSLDDYVADLIATLGYERYPALWEMWERIATKRLLFIRQRLVDGKPYSPWDHPTIHGTPKPYFPEVVDANDFRSNYKFEFDDHDRVKVFSHEWSDYRYTVAEPPRPPASQTAPDQQRKAKAGPEPSKKPKETLETRLIDLMKELRLKSGMFPREVRAIIKQPFKDKFKDKYDDQPARSTITRAYKKYTSAKQRAD